jgi:hypothetical protein
MHYNKSAAALNYATGKGFVPFTIESAIMYSYSREVAEGRGIPLKDESLLGMENIPVRNQMSLGLEYFLGYGYRLKKMLFGVSPGYPESESYEDNPDFTSWARFQIRLWTSLTAGLIFLWLILMRCPWHIAILGGLLHAVSPAAIARYTGQDLVRGEFCLPLIMLALVLGWWAFRKASPLKLIALGFAVFAAMASWDMCQVLFSLWALWEIIRLLCGARINRKRRNVWLVIYISLVFAALLVPYHWTHGLIVSPLLLILIPLILCMHFFVSYEKGARSRFLVLIVSLALLFAAWKIASSGAAYSGNYSHFGELVKAKLVHWNVKPKDPRKLNFDARILWTPALHTPSWRDMLMFFPAAIYGLFVLFGGAFAVSSVRKSVMRGLGRSFFPLFMTFVFFIAYNYFSRFHVFCALFLCVAAPMILCDWMRAFKSKLPGFVVYMLALLFLLAETDISSRLERKYVVGGGFKEKMALIRWFRDSGVRDKGVLADMTLSPMLKAYCQEKILLQPKFELGKTRKLVEEYINLMFHGTEEELNKFCVEHKIDFIVFENSYSYISDLHIYSNRYMAAALQVKKDSPAFLLKHKSNDCKWFYRIDPPKSLQDLSNNYTLFKVISPKDRITAMRYSAKGEAALRYGKSKLAKKLARKAFYIDPAYIPSRTLYAMAYGYVPEIKLSDYK